MGATVITVIEGILGVLFVLGGLLVMLGMGILGGAVGAAGGDAGVGGFFAGLGIVLGIIVIVIGALYLLIAYGVWKARGWSWMLAMVVSIIVLVFALLGLGGRDHRVDHHRDRAAGDRHLLPVDARREAVPRAPGLNHSLPTKTPAGSSRPASSIRGRLALRALAGHRLGSVTCPERRRQRHRSSS